MRIDQIDLSIIRAVENGARPFLNTIAQQLKIEKEEVARRLARIEKEKLILNYKLTIQVPFFLGGDWILGCAFGITSHPESLISYLAQNFCFVLEVFQNLSFPNDIGPDLNILFYTQDFPASAKFLKALKGFDYIEVLKVKDFSFPLPAPLTKVEQKLLKQIYHKPLTSLSEMVDSLNQDKNWIQEKINRLVGLRLNDKIGSILPEINWMACENFRHIHFLVEKKTTKDCQEDFKLEQMLSNHPFKERLYQLEADIWGFDNLCEKLNELNQSGLDTKGFILAQTNRVINDWITKLLP